jgi:hypothetical protein
MKWIKIKDQLPTDYDIYYVVLVTNPCEGCDKNESHGHKLNFIRHEVHIANRSEKDPWFVEQSRKKGDHYWDNWLEDQWTDTDADDRYITHWFPLPPIDK